MHALKNLITSKNSILNTEKRTTHTHYLVVCHCLLRLPHLALWCLASSLISRQTMRSERTSSPLFTTRRTSSASATPRPPSPSRLCSFPALSLISPQARAAAGGRAGAGAAAAGDLCAQQIASRDVRDPPGGAVLTRCRVCPFPSPGRPPRRALWRWMLISAVCEVGGQRE